MRRLLAGLLGDEVCGVRVGAVFVALAAARLVLAERWRRSTKPARLRRIYFKKGHLMALLVSINVGLPRDVAWRGERVHTAIWKQPVGGRIAVRGSGAN